MDAAPRPTTGVVIPQQDTIDEFANTLARIGFGTTSLLEGTSYPLTRLTRNYMLMQSLYRTNWIARKIIDAQVEDMFKNWIELTTELEPEQLERFSRLIRATQTKAALQMAVKWGRLFGGGGAVMIIKGHENVLDQPLELDDVPVDSYRGLLVFDRWSGIYPDAVIEDNPDNATDFGLPLYYRIQLENGRSQRVHCSRVLRFIGRDLPFWEKQVEMQWGISEFEVIWSELRKRDNTSFNIANLIFRANIMAMRMPDMAQMLSGIDTGGRAQARIASQLQAMNWMMSNQGMVVLPAEGSLENHTYSFAGISEVYQSFMMDICGAAEYPFTRLFGRTQTGLGQSNKGDDYIYMGMLAMKQESQISPQLDKLLPVVGMSLWGEVPPDLDYRWLPIRELDDEEMSRLGTSISNDVVNTFNAGIISQQTAMMELKQSSKITGRWTNITDEDIASADKIPQSQQQALTPLPGAEMGEASLPPAEGEGGTSTSEGEASPTFDSQPKHDKSEVDFESPAKGPHHCSECVHYLSGAQACAIVNGQIRPGDWCQEFKQGTLDAAIPIFIEQPVGSTREGVAPDGVKWRVRFANPYGYIEGTAGADGQELDVFLGPDKTATYAYVIHQNKLSGEYDEDKVMLGFHSPQAAKAAYWAHYDRPELLFDSMETVPLHELITQEGIQLVDAKKVRK